MSSSSSAPPPGRGSSSAVLEARHFTRHLAELLAKEHAAMVDFVLALAEFDGRRLWVDLGYASLFDFLHRELGMSAGAAFYRKTAAGLVQRFPAIVDALADGRICITSVPQIAKVITDENAVEVIPQFFHRSKREAKEVAAAIAPHTAPVHRDLITTVRSDVPRRLTADDRNSSLPPESRPPEASDTGEIELGPEVDAIAAPSGDRGGSSVEAAPAQLRTELRRPPVADHIEPLTASLRRVHMTVSDRWVQKLETLRAALSHSHPAGRAEEVTEYALDLALEHVARKSAVRAKSRAAVPARSAGGTPARRRHRRASDATARSDGNVTDAAAGKNAECAAGPESQPQQPQKNVPARRAAIPAEVRRAVMSRDAGRCQWKLHDGTVCGSNVRVQLDHVHPVALGGASTVDNLRLLCARHNQLAAQRFFGEGWMTQFARPTTTGARDFAAEREHRATDSS